MNCLTYKVECIVYRYDVHLCNSFLIIIHTNDQKFTPLLLYKKTIMMLILILQLLKCICIFFQDGNFKK